MSVIKDTFFGGAEKKAARAQEQSLKEAQAITREGIEQARGDIMRLFPQSQTSATQGFQGALDVFNQALPQQAQALTGGNVAAQNALLAGLPSMQAAILGTPMPELNLQPFQFQPNFDFANQTIPTQQAQTQQQPQQPTMQSNPFGTTGILSGARNLANEFGNMRR